MGILGIDLSLNHAGFVELNSSGRVEWFAFVSDTRAAADREHGVYLPRSKVDDRQQAGIERLAWWSRYLRQALDHVAPLVVGIEDYAFLAQSNAAYQLGELGGVARLAALGAGARLRLHEPQTVKMFGTGSGAATGQLVAHAVRAEIGDLFAACNQPAKPGKAQNTLPEEDLAAAYVVARLVWTEIELRAGRMALSSLDEQRLRVFNRCTKAHPINLLARDWLELPRTSLNP